MIASLLLKRLLNLQMAMLALILLSATGRSQDPSATPAQPDPLASLPVQVLDQQQVEIGAHIITFNRIAPPVFPAPTPTLPAVNQPQPQANQAPPPKTSSRAARARGKATGNSPHAASGGEDADGEEKSYKALMLSATVYDHQFTEVRWPGNPAPALRAYVNIDFRYFTTVTNLETADTVYDLFFAWSNDTMDSLTQAGRTPPNLSAFPAGRASYQIVVGDAGAHPDAVAALDALCAHYDAHSAQMIAAYNQREAANAAHQQWLLDHPPVQPDTVVNYWPAKNSVYLNQSN